MVEKNKKELLVPLTLFLITILTRVPFTSEHLFHFDSINFALALEKYDITTHQPHPPGYFLYIMLGRVLSLYISDANTVFVTISIIFSGLTVVALYFLGKDLHDRTTGLIASLIAITSPNFWFHGEVALTYVVETFFSILVAYLCWKIIKGEHKYIWFSAIVLGLAGGIRQNTVVFLFPLWLFSVRTVPVKKIVLALGLLGLVCLSWFVPMVWMTGGWDAYREAFRDLWEFTAGHHSVFEKGWPAFKRFLSLLLFFILFGIGSGVIVFFLALYSIMRYRRTSIFNSRKLTFYLLWVLPAILFHLLIFIHPSNPGYALAFTSPLLLVIALSVVHVGNELKRLSKRNVTCWITIFLIILNTAGFVRWPYKFIKDHDIQLSILLDGIKSFDPQHHAIFSLPYTFHGFRHIMYYLPEYHVYQIEIKSSLTGRSRKICWGINRESFLTDGIVLPKGLTNVLVPLAPDDVHEIVSVQGMTVVRESKSTYVFASVPAGMIQEAFPKLKVRIAD